MRYLYSAASLLHFGVRMRCIHIHYSIAYITHLIISHLDRDRADHVPQTSTTVMNRLTGDIITEIQSFLDDSSFYCWILACHAVEVQGNSEDDEPRHQDVSSADMMKSGRPMIHAWLSDHVQFPIAKIKFGGTMGYQRILEKNEFSRTPLWLDNMIDMMPDGERKTTTVASPGPNYFLDCLISVDNRKSSINTSGANWFSQILPPKSADVNVVEHQEEETNATGHTYQKLSICTARLLSDAITYQEYFRHRHLRQYPLMVALDRYGCLRYPPNDKMFAIPSANSCTCLDNATCRIGDNMNCNFANSLTALDIVTMNERDEDAIWELGRDYSYGYPVGRLFVRWGANLPEDPNAWRSRGRPAYNFVDAHFDSEQYGQASGAEYGYLPWCGSSATSNGTRDCWKKLRPRICEWLDARLEELDDDDEDFEFEIQEQLWCTEYGGHPMDDIDLGDENDNEGVALVAYRDLLDAEEEQGIPREKILAIKTQARQGLVQWKEYFGGNNDQQQDEDDDSYYDSEEDDDDEPENDDNIDENKATWKSIGLADRGRLRFDPVAFAHWATAMADSQKSNQNGRHLSRSALDLLQFTAEDLGLGISWQIEGMDGEVASALLGPHGSLWILHDDNTDIKQLLEPFQVSSDGMATDSSGDSDEEYLPPAESDTGSKMEM